MSYNPSAESSNTLPVPSLPIIRGSGQLPPPPPIANAEKLTDFALAKQEQVLDLQDSKLNIQDQEALEIEIKNGIEVNKRRVSQEIKESYYKFDDALFAHLDLVAQYDYQTAGTDALKNIRAVNKAFSDRWREVVQQIQFYEDEIAAHEKILADTPTLINSAIARGDFNTAEILTAQLANSEKLLLNYKGTGEKDAEGKVDEGILGKFIEQEKQVQEANDKALDFVKAQNQLKIHQEKLNKRSLLNNQKLAYAEQRGTLEQQRKLKLKAEELRLTIAIADLRLNKTPEEAEELIKGERRQSRINLENIDLEAQLDELDLEKRLLDLQGEIRDKRSAQLSRFGLNFGAEKLKRENAIDQENLRFKRYLIEINKELAGEPDLLAEFTANAEELNRVNFGQIENQFKSLGKTFEDYFTSSTQGFFDQFTTNFFDGKSQRDQQVLQERLRYAEELVQLENQYRDEPGKLYHLKSRAKELNEQKLDKISGQFNIFKRAVDLGRQALLEFVKQLAKMAAQQAAARFLSSIIRGALGGIGGVGVPSVGNDFGSSAAGVSAFVADQGVTVGSGDIKQRQISDRATNYLRRTFPGIAQAWNSEGEGAQLGVFHTGEELLSRKTGEAGRYQVLKQKLGTNPLARIGVFADGGTVLKDTATHMGFDAGSNILAGFSDYRPRIDLSGLNEGRRQKAEGRRELHLTQQIFTPNQDSFMLNADQRNQDLLESLQRGF